MLLRLSEALASWWTMAISEQTLGRAASWSGAPPVALSLCPSQPELLIKFLTWLQILMNHFCRMVLQWGLVLLPPIKPVQGMWLQRALHRSRTTRILSEAFQDCAVQYVYERKNTIDLPFHALLPCRGKLPRLLFKGKSQNKNEIKWENDKMRNFIGRDSNITLCCPLLLKPAP